MKQPDILAALEPVAKAFDKLGVLLLLLCRVSKESLITKHSLELHAFSKHQAGGAGFFLNEMPRSGNKKL